LARCPLVPEGRKAGRKEEKQGAGCQGGKEGQEEGRMSSKEVRLKGRITEGIKERKGTERNGKERHVHAMGLMCRFLRIRLLYLHVKY
jgi:hypothetical protein